MDTPLHNGRCVMDANASFGHWLRQRRKALDLTQDELAQRVACARSMLQKIEADERRPSLQMAEALARALGLAPDEFPAFIEFARAGQRATVGASVSCGRNGNEGRTRFPAPISWGPNRVGPASPVSHSTTGHSSLRFARTSVAPPAAGL